MNELGSNPVDKQQTLSTEQSDQLCEVKIFYDFENLEEPFQNVPICTNSSSALAGNELENNSETLEQLQIDVLSGIHHSEAMGKVPRLQQRIVESNPGNAATGIWAESILQKKTRGRKRKQISDGSVDTLLRIRSHLRYLLHRIKYENSLIDAYSAEGWKKQSVEKIKPEKELQHARFNILRYKLKTRELFQHIDQLLAIGRLPESLFNSNGEIGSEDIFCAKCGSKDLTVDNDIILCDGACQRGFHQFCLEPPLLRENFPPDDEGWLCPGCECKADCIHMLKDFQETKASILDNWEKIFPEAAVSTLSKELDDGSGLSSNDTDNDRYNPDKKDPDRLEKVIRHISSSDKSQFSSAPEDLVAPVNNNIYLGFLSEDSEDDDFDPSATDKDEKVQQDSSSSDFTSDSEDLGGLLDHANVDGNSVFSSPACQEWQCTSSNKEKTIQGRTKRKSQENDLLFLLENCDELLPSKRHVERLDYKKLNDETFGDCSDSSDDDFEETVPHKSRSVGSTSLSIRDLEKETLLGPSRSQRKLCDGGANPKIRRSTYRCLDEAVTELLFKSFKQNQYPERSVKESLAKELGLTIQQVGKWFDNTRWRFHNRPQTESCVKNESDSENLSTVHNQDQPTLPGSASPMGTMACQESKAISDGNCPSLIKVEKSATDPSQANA